MFGIGSVLDASEPSLRPLARADFPTLGAWLAQPHVARWWNHGTSPQAVEADFGAVVNGGDPAEIFIAAAREQPFGLVQRYTVADHPGRHRRAGRAHDRAGRNRLDD